MTEPTEQQFEGLRTIDKPPEPHLIKDKRGFISSKPKKPFGEPEEHGGVLANPEQPSQNSMIFEQVNGSVKVALELLGQLETRGTNEEEQKQGCIWTLKDWRDNNLEHLQKALG